MYELLKLKKYLFLLINFILLLYRIHNFNYLIVLISNLILYILLLYRVVLIKMISSQFLLSDWKLASYYNFESGCLDRMTIRLGFMGDK